MVVLRHFLEVLRGLFFLILVLQVGFFQTMRKTSIFNVLPHLKKQCFGVKPYRFFLFHPQTHGLRAECLPYRFSNWNRNLSLRTAILFLGAIGDHIITWHLSGLCPNRDWLRCGSGTVEDWRLKAIYASTTVVWSTRSNQPLPRQNERFVAQNGTKLQLVLKRVNN